MNAPVSLHTQDARPPENLEAEQALLGALLFDNAVADQVREHLKPGDFYEPMHGRIYAACLELIDAGIRASPVTLRPRFEKDEALKDVGGAGYLVSLMDARIVTSHAQDYGRAIYEAALRRNLTTIGQTMVAAASDFSQPAENIIDEAERELFEARHAGVQQSRIGPIVDALDEALQQADRAARDEGGRGVTTGLAELDRRMNGLRPSSYILLGARTSVGKSALAASIARSAAEAGAGVGIFSLEMPRAELAIRLATDVAWRQDAPINYADVMAGRIEPGHFDRLNVARTHVQRLPILVDDRRGIPVTAIRASARRMARTFERSGRRLSLLVVDHLGKVRESGRARVNTVERHAEVSADLFSLAAELQCCVMALVQLNRETEKREDKRPTLSDIRWAGDLEQDADVVAFLYREAYYLERQPMPSEPHEAARHKEKLAEVRNVAEIILAKNRMGPICTVKAYVDIGANAFRDFEAVDPAQGAMPI